jgi:diaminopimelate epimerase
MTHPVQFTKGHGTGNDFVLVADLEDDLIVTPQAVRAVCDRRFGVGGDGLIRVVRDADGVHWFMDYHNADGSIGQMCGNGARVFAVMLRELGLVHADRFAIQTRGGLREVSLRGDQISVDMGPARSDPATVKVTSNSRSWDAHAVFMPNPHAVAFVDDLQEPGDLRRAPLVESDAFDDGVNVEFVVTVQPGEHVAMRVHERGVGETASCGTGVCAVADTALHEAGVHGPARIRVDVPGGTLHVERTAGSTLVLTGPAVLVAQGTLSPQLSEMFRG